MTGEQQATPLQGERRVVTVMFADLSGFTAISERMDPEYVRNLINACFEELVGIVTAYGGIVEKFIGDEIMAIFGAPVAHEDDAQRAVRVAFLMQNQLQRFNATRGTDLGMHFGINTGLVIAGGIGTTARQDYGVMGDAVNVAARLADVAERGEILVGAETYRLTSHAFEFQQARPIRVKGKSEPVPVIKAVGLRRPEEALRVAKAGRRVGSVMIGRDVEMAALLACSDRLMRGEGGILTILGEPGLGKSRLVAEAQRRLGTRELLFLEGRALSLGQTLPYWPMLEVIRAFANVIETDEEAVALEKLTRRLRALFGEDVRDVLPYLATLLGLELRDEEMVLRVKHLPSEAMRSQVLLTTRRFFERLCQDHPVLLTIEDLHWADEASLQLLEHLMPLIESVPLLLCLVSRTDPGTAAERLLEHASTKYQTRHTEIVVNPLSPTERATLFETLLGTSAVPSRLRETILSRTGGNPFFLEEVTRALIDLGGLVYDPVAEAWQATGSLETIVIPQTVQGVIMARIDRLQDDVKQVLKMAAVIGRSFFYRVLSAIAHADRALDHHLDELQKIEMIREKSRTPEIEYFFKHALAQEAAYESILFERRRQLHREVAECMEGLFAERLEEFYGLLAYHYARAEVWEKAQEYLFKSGDQAGRVAADAEALGHYRQALVAYERAFGDRWNPLDQAALARKMGEALFRRGDHEQALEYLERALASLGAAPLPRSSWQISVAIARDAIYQATIRILPAIVRHGRRDARSAVIEEQARVYTSLGWIDYFTNNRARLVLSGLRVLNASERAGLSIKTVEGFFGIGLICNLIPFHRLAGAYHRLALKAAHASQEQLALGHAHLGAAIHAQHSSGEWERALEHAVEAARRFWECGDLRRWGAALSIRSYVLLLKGNFTAALEAAETLSRVGSDAGDRQIAAWGNGDCALVLMQQRGALDEASRKLEQAIESAKAVPDYACLAFSTSLLGVCALGQGLTEKARRLAEESWRILSSRRLRLFFVAPALNAITEVFLATAEQAASNDRARALKEAKRVIGAGLGQARITWEGRPGVYRNYGSYEWIRQRPGPARTWWQKSLAAAEKVGAPYEIAKTYLEIGRSSGSAADLERAESIFIDIGSRLHLVEIRRRLRNVETSSRQRT